MIPNASEIARFEEVCKSIASEVADDDGFVPVRQLLARFHTRVFLRPLLVEAMFAALNRNGEKSSTTDWVVLLDSETYRVDEKTINEESAGHPLPVRLRNTVAHELAHSLAFRPSEFGIRLRAEVSGRESRESLVKSMEREIEKLSPLLLCSEKAIGRLLAGKDCALSTGEVVLASRRMAVSRYVFINRLSLLGPAHNFRNHKALSDIAIGIGKWVDEGNAVLKGWPVFANFRRNVVPSFLHDVITQESVPARSIFKDQQFSICGGQHDTIELQAEAGTRMSPAAERISVECSIEHVERRPGNEFFFLVRRLVPRNSENQVEKSQPVKNATQLDLFS